MSVFWSKISDVRADEPEIKSLGVLSSKPR